MLERETRREKILESKLRELKLRVKTAAKHDDDDESRGVKSTESIAACNQSRKEFMEAVDCERMIRNPSLKSMSARLFLTITAKFQIRTYYNFIILQENIRKFQKVI